MNEWLRNIWNEFKDDPLQFVIQRGVQCFIFLLLLGIVLAMIRPAWHMVKSQLQNW